ncbi:MAG: ATP-binding protein [Polyangiaceae bacterium]
MRLALRLTLFLVAAMMVVLAVYASVSIRDLVGLFESDTWRDHEVLGRALAASAASVWKSEGVERAAAVVQGAQAGETSLSASWQPLDAPTFEPQPPAAAWAGVRAGREAHWAAGSELFSAFPVEHAGVRAAIVIRESLSSRDAYLRGAVRDAVLTVLGLVAVSSLLASVLGVSLVGRPVHALVEQARRVGQGDLSRRLAVERRDELGELAAEMNSMVDAIDAAHQRVENESQARLRALEQLRHADRLSTVGKLASGVAHELGTPLNVVSGRAKMIERGQVAGEGAQDNARIIVQQTERMTHIIRQLLDFARVRAPKDAPLELAELATRVVELLRPLAKKNSVDLELELERAGGSYRTRGDRAELEQVLSNLIVNAVQASTSPNRVTVTVRKLRRLPPAELGGSEAEYVELGVTDRGSGVPKEVAPHVFEPFFTTKEVGEGTGLGLSVAYGIAREHGGFIELESDPGQQTTFSVYLPCEES